MQKHFHEFDNLFDDEGGAVAEDAAVHPMTALKVTPHVEAAEEDTDE